VIQCRPTSLAGDEVVARSDDHGRFAFLDLPGEEVRLLVAEIPLREAGSAAEVWQPEPGRQIVVEPSVPVAGLCFVEDVVRVDAPAATPSAAPPIPRPPATSCRCSRWKPSRGCPRLHAWVEGFGHFTAEIDADERGSDGLLVRTDAPRDDLQVLARPASEGLDVATWRNGIRAEKLDTGWLLGALEPGPYELLWLMDGAGLRRAFPDPVDVTAREAHRARRRDAATNGPPRRDHQLARDLCRSAPQSALSRERQVLRHTSSSPSPGLAGFATI
jgi:hypothetical protein